MTMDLSVLIQDYRGKIFTSLAQTSEDHNTFLRIALFCVISLVVWRIYRFTIVPILHPDEPRELPYWAPRMSMSRYSSCGPGARTLKALTQFQCLVGGHTEPPSEWKL